MPPPPLAPGALFPAPAPMLPRGPAPAFAPAYPPIFYWPYPSPPVSPTSYYNPAASVPGIAPMPQQAALVSILHRFVYAFHFFKTPTFAVIVVHENNQSSCSDNFCVIFVDMV